MTPPSPGIYLPLRLRLPEQAPIAPIDYAQRLPGLTYVKLVSYWQQRYPMECNGPTSGNRQLIWNCSLASGDGAAYLTMTIVANSGDTVTRVSITVLQTSSNGRDAGETWLRYAAETPLVGVSPEAVRAWIAEIGDGSGSTRIGSVKFSLLGPSASRTLELSPAQPPQ